MSLGKGWLAGMTWCHVTLVLISTVFYTTQCTRRFSTTSTTGTKGYCKETIICYTVYHIALVLLVLNSMYAMLHSKIHRTSTSHVILVILNINAIELNVFLIKLIMIIICHGVNNNFLVKEGFWQANTLIGPYRKLGKMDPFILMQCLFSYRQITVCGLKHLGCIFAACSTWSVHSDIWIKLKVWSPCKYQLWIYFLTLSYNSKHTLEIIQQSIGTLALPRTITNLYYLVISYELLCRWIDINSQ